MNSHKVIWHALNSSSAAFCLKVCATATVTAVLQHARWVCHGVRCFIAWHI